MSGSSVAVGGFGRLSSPIVRYPASAGHLARHSGVWRLAPRGWVPQLRSEDAEELMRSITSEESIFRARARKRRGGLWVCLWRHGPVPRQRLQGKGQLWIGVKANSNQAADPGTNRPADPHRDDPLEQAARPCSGHRADRLGQDHHAVLDDLTSTMRRDDAHIVNIMNLTEYYHNHKKAVVTQREVHVDVPSFAEALRRALRQIRTLSLSASCATLKRWKPPLPPLKRATWFSAPCTPPARPRPSTVWSTPFP